MNDILATVNTWLDQNRAIALATVVETWGSAPRGVGAKMAITEDMAIVGSVSGGCVETAVISEALEALKDAKPRLLHFGVSDETAWSVGLTCGGQITVYVELLDRAFWQVIQKCLEQQQSFRIVTLLTSGAKAVFEESGDVLYITNGDQPITQAVFQQVQSGRLVEADDTILVEIYHPQPRLIIIGGVHVAIPLTIFAEQLGFRVAIVDPRRIFATQERFPNVPILHTYPDKALPQLGLDSDTYIAILTHDPKIDDSALKISLPSPVKYIGILSSRSTHEKRLTRLEQAGIDPQLFSRIRTPIGLNLGAKTPEEIALCIMAEIVAVRNNIV